MEHTINIDKPERLTLTDENQKKIVGFVADVVDKGGKARKKYEQNWKDCERAYHCEPHPLDEEDEWQTNMVLPWAYDAIESAYAHLCNTMVPRDEQVFDATGRTEEDHPGVKVMAQYLEHRLDEAGFVAQIYKSFKQILKRNHTCLKIYWRTDKRVSHDIQVDPMTGQRRRMPSENVVFNNVWFDVVDIDNFYMYPIHGDFEKVNKVHRTRRHLEELKAENEEKKKETGEDWYFNLDRIDQKKDNQAEAEKAATTGEQKTFEGLKIDEAWLSRIEIDDKVYHNYVATIVNEKHLIRFAPNPYDMGKTPYVWSCANPDGDCLYGYGLISKGLKILDNASFIHNTRSNELKLKIYSGHKYYDDGVFNAYNYIQRPGLLVRMASAESAATNLVPIAESNIMLGEARAELAELKAEFESVTVPKVVKGITEVTNRTATEIGQAQNNASTKLHVFANQLNNDLLKPLLEMMYMMIYQRKDVDPSVLEDIARLTQESTIQMDTDPSGQPLEEPVTVARPIEEMIADLPELLPLPEIDIKMVGYMNVIRKQEALASIGQVIPQLLQSPAAKYLKWDNIAEDVLRMADLDYNNLLMDADERAEVDAKEQEQVQQQQQMAMQMQQQQAELEQMKAVHQMKMDEFEKQLKYMDMELKYSQPDLQVTDEAKTYANAA